MPIIKKSKIEYISYAVNWIRGCPHACTYCYMQAIASRFSLIAAADEWRTPVPVYADPAAELARVLAGRRTPLTGTVLLASAHDPAYDSEVAAQTAALVGLRHQHAPGATVLVLSKAPHNLAGLLPTSTWLGASITALGRSLQEQYEPGAADPATRLAALAAHPGPTWISFEPPLPGVFLRALVPATLAQLPARPWVVLGKLNYRGADADLRAWAASNHWATDRDATVAGLQAAGYTASSTPAPGTYYVKRELAKC